VIHRKVIVQVAPSLLLAVLVTGWSGDGIRTIDGLPESAQLVDFRFDLFRGVIDLLVEDESFNPVPEGAAIPVKNIVLQRVSEDAL
jgi:hypothetical protein